MPSGAEPARAESRWPMLLAPLLVAAVAVGGGALLARAILHDAAATRRPLRFIPVSGETGGADPAVSPDGTRVAWARPRDDGGSDIAVRLLAGGPPVTLTSGPAADGHPVWSPDGTRLAFVRVSPDGCGLRVVTAGGGGQRGLGPCPDPEHRALSWSPDGRWLAHTRDDGRGRRGLALLGVEDGEVHPLTTPPEGDLGDAWPAFSPDGRLLAFVRSKAPGVADLYRIDLAGGEPVRLTRDLADVVGVAWIGGGRGLVFASNRAGLHSLWSVSASGGEPRRLAGGGSRLQQPSASRDGRVVAYEEWDDASRLWRVPLASDGAALAVTAEDGEQNREPAVSPDGTRIAWSSTRSGTWELWVAAADGSAPRRVSDLGGPLVGQPRWSPDGRHLVAVARPEGQADLYVSDLEGGWRRLTRHPADDVAPEWSRDGRSVLFASRRGGRFGVWRVPAGGGDPAPVQGDDADSAAESPGGAWLYYTRADRRGLWRRPVAGGAEQTVLSERLPGRARDWVLNEAGLFYPAAVRDETWLLRAEPDGSDARPLVPLAQPGGPGLDVSPEGAWLYRPRAGRSSSRIVALTRDP